MTRKIMHSCFFYRVIPIAHEYEYFITRTKELTFEYPQAAALI